MCSGMGLSIGVVQGGFDVVSRHIFIVAVYLIFYSHVFVPLVGGGPKPPCWLECVEADGPCVGWLIRPGDLVGGAGVASRSRLGFIDAYGLTCLEVGDFVIHIFFPFKKRSARGWPSRSAFALWNSVPVLSSANIRADVDLMWLSTNPCTV